MRPVLTTLLLLTLAGPGAVPARADDGTGDEPAPPPVESPEEASKPPAPERPWGLRAEAEYWFAQPVGSDFDFATVRAPDSPQTSTIPFGFGTENRARWKASFVLPKDAGEVFLTYWSSRITRDAVMSSPGNFVFGEIQALPIYSGVLDDGYADGVFASAHLQTRDLRLEYRHTLATTDRSTVEGFVGFHTVDHDRRTEVAYYGLAATLPPFIDPDTGAALPTLEPTPDLVQTRSRFSGRGISVGAKYRFEIAAERVWIEATFDWSLLRGSKTSTFFCSTAAWAVNDAGQLLYVPPEDLGAVIEDGTLGPSLVQVRFPVSLTEGKTSQSASVFESSVGVRWRVWKTFEILGGIRTSRYQNLVDDIRPTAVGSDLSVLDYERTSRSLGYEGFYLGAGYRY